MRARGHGASADPGLDLHRHDGARAQREAGGRLDAGPGDRHAGRRHGAGDFYILCPDNEVTREVDNRRILWAAEDITQNRPPLSRWHAEYKDAFNQYLQAEK